MNVTNWNGEYYRVGGSFFYNDHVYTIKSLELEVVQAGTSILVRKQILRITTENGKVIKLVEDIK